jgi:hypothetical protein
MVRGKSLLTIILGLAVSSAAASASSLPITAVLYGTSDTPAGVSPGTTDLTVQFGTTGIANCYVGQLNWHNAGPAGAITPELQSVINPSTGNFGTYCIEGNEDVLFGQTATWADGVVSLSNAPDTANPPGALVPNPPHFTSQQITDLTEFWNRFHDSVSSNQDAAAFQLGIWEIVSDDVSGIAADIAANPINVSNPLGVFKTGTFQAMNDDAITTQAQNWLAQVGSGTAYTNQYTLFALAGPGTQDQIFGVVGGGATPPGVPLPAALPAGLALMGGLGVAKFWRRRSL